MPQDKEIERKYIIPNEVTLKALLEDARTYSVHSLKISDFRGPLSRVDTYYDTADFKLLRQGQCFRLGSAGEKLARLNFKAPTSIPEERIEIKEGLLNEEALAAIEGLYPSRVMTVLYQHISSAAISSVLIVYKFFYAFYVKNCEVVFGRVIFERGEGLARRFDLEVEAKEGASLADVEEVSKILERYYDLKPDMRSKYQTGMELLGGVKNV